MKQPSLASTPEGMGTICIRIVYADGMEHEVCSHKPESLAALAERLQGVVDDLRRSIARKTIEDT